MIMNFASHTSNNTPAYPLHAFPQAWSAQDLADAVPLRLFEAVDFDALSLPVEASNAPAVPAARAWRRRYADAGNMPAVVRVR
jgi:hypothetical protein